MRFDTKMKHIKQEQSDELRYKQVCRQLMEEQRRIEGLKEDYESPRHGPFIRRA